MNKFNFFVSDRDFRKRLSSDIQHKLRVLMKCYTIKNFLLNEDQSFSFNKSHKIKGIRIDDEKMYNGIYEFEFIDEKHIKIILTVF
jgi:hypothetical protein